MYTQTKNSTHDQIKKIIFLLIGFVIIWQIYNFTYKATYGDFLSGLEIADVPESLKCFFNEDKCEEGDLDGWTVAHIVMYFIIGYVVPDQYLAILFISIVWELFQPMIGSNAMFIINPLVNLTGYSLGSVLSQKKKPSYDKKYELFVKKLNN